MTLRFLDRSITSEKTIFVTVPKDCLKSQDPPRVVAPMSVITIMKKMMMMKMIMMIMIIKSNHHEKN